MPIRRHGNGWEVRVQHSGQRFSRTFGDRKHAQEYEARMRGRIADSRLGRTPQYTLAEALTRWLEGEAKALRSHRNLTNKVRAIYPFVGDRLLSEIVEVAEAVKSAGINSKLSPATINRRLAALRRVANLAYRQWSWLDQPLGDRIKLLPGERQRHEYLTPAEVKRLARLAPAPARGAILLAAMTGLRRGELLALKAGDRRDGALYLPDSKSGRPRVVPLPPEAMRIALPLRVTDEELRRAWDEAREKAKLPHIRFHDLRHTYASWLAQAGVSLVVIRDLLGHSSLSVTSRYSHLQTSHLRDAVTNIPAGLGRSRKAAKK